MIELFHPMLLSKKNEAFDSRDFLFELKFDGVRMLAYIFEDIRLINRKLNERTAQYPDIISALKDLGLSDTVLDGEIVAFDNEGNQSFSKILERDQKKKYNKENNIPIMYIVFDVLYHNGENIMGLSLIERKEVLSKIIKPKSTIIRQSDFHIESGKLLFNAAKQANLEGIVAKRLDSIYRKNTRSADWIKIKSVRNLDAFIGGYQKKSRPSMCIGVKNDDGLLDYVGNVSNGLDEKTSIYLEQFFIKNQSSLNPFSNFKSKSVTFLKSPFLKMNVEYLEQTENGTLRQPVIKKIY